MPRVSLYWQVWTIEQDEVSGPRILSVGMKARRAEVARQIVKMVRRSLWFMLLLGGFGIKGLW